MKLIIAEKPDQGAKLAAPFKSKKHQGYIEIFANSIFPQGAYITWAVGHICQLLNPEEYDPSWKKWSMNNLPIIPAKFQYKVMRSKGKQFQLIKKLLHSPKVTEIIIAGDAGREGELIVRTIVHLCKVQKPMKRLWISSLTENAVKQGFQRLLDESETRNLYYEAYSRACADWLIGMNASRIYTLLLKEKEISDVFSVGRVQTPTLALIVKREEEILQFTPELFWEVLASFTINGMQYEGKWENDKGDSRIKERQMAEAISAFCHDKDAEVSKLKQERKEFLPPYLFNLSTLQASANKAFKFSPKKTLDIAQKLYVKGILSYPRTDSNFVTKGEGEMFPHILKQLNQFADYKPFFPLPNESILHNKRYVNEKKVTDHYAIIPTEQVIDPSKLSGDERKIYDLVVRRLIAAHYDKAIFDYTTIETLVDHRAKFVSKGKQLIQQGWRKVLFHQEKEDNAVLLPNVGEGDNGNVVEVKIKDGKTQPPKRYTEGQLITLMKTAGKYIENEELEKVLQKTEGLGTEATRAGIITILKDRKYIEVNKNQVYATDKGRVLIRAIGDKILASPEMTAKWEQRLSEIGEGKAAPVSFIEATKKLSMKIIDDARKTVTQWDFSNLEIEQIQRKPKTKAKKSLGLCKMCGGKVIDKGTFYGCLNYSKTKCTFSVSKIILGKKITQANVKRLLTDGKTDKIKDLKKDEKTFDAYLIWDEKEQRIRFNIAE
ncbi:DNA topoisomerase III [Anaerobacillus sp. MEB173]|uniref:DNA topoisomerase III n=1 Tax=Anaerobacillus sp. MEB173 TaxID=3383345 RepID=UPI003F8E1EF4